MNFDDAVRYMNLSKVFSTDELKQSYRRLAKKYHPDMGGTTESFQKLQTAYGILQNQGGFYTSQTGKSNSKKSTPVLDRYFKMSWDDITKPKAIRLNFQIGRMVYGLNIHNSLHCLDDLANYNRLHSEKIDGVQVNCYCGLDLSTLPKYITIDNGNMIVDLIGSGLKLTPKDIRKGFSFRLPFTDNTGYRCTPTPNSEFKFKKNSILMLTYKSPIHSGKMIIAIHYDKLSQINLLRVRMYLKEIKTKIKNTAIKCLQVFK